MFGDVIPNRGVHQSDPISPYIYIICVEGLSSIIRKNEEVCLLHGCFIAWGAPTISHILFANDYYFFFRSIKTEANVMKRIPDMYENISGQMINYAKSSITFSPNTIIGNKEKDREQLKVSEVQNPVDIWECQCLWGGEMLQLFRSCEKIEQKF